MAVPILVNILPPRKEHHNSKERGVRMRKILALFLVSLMVFGSLLSVLPVGTASTGSRLLTTPDGLSWADPVKVTSNNVDDAHPTLVVDSAANAHILYYQNGQDFKYQKYQRPGKLVIRETQIVSGPMAFQHAAFGTPNAEPTERIGIDGDENIHVIWAAGGDQWSPGLYQKFSNTGKPLSQVMDPTPTATTPHIPYINVGKNNYAYIGTEQEGGGENGQLTRFDKNFQATTVDVKPWTEGISLVVDNWNDDVVHYFTRTWQGSGIFHTKFTADMQKVVEPHSIYEGLGAGTGWDSPMPLATTTPNGHVHLLLYSQTANPKTMYYGELDKMGNMLSAGQTITVTQDACDYGDIVGDGENNVYIIWGACSDGHVYYTKVLEGNEQSSLTRKPIKISAGLVGQSSQPQFGVDPDNGLHVVFLNNGDGDNEVYYRYAYTFGVELKMEPTEQAKMMFIHPMEIKTGNLTIKNVGGQNDTMYLNVTMNLMGHEDQGWDAWLSESTVELQPSEVAKIELSVKGPDFGNPNDFIEVCVNATSSRNPDKNDTICLRVYLAINHNLRLDCANDVAIVGGGEKTEFVCNLKNNGDVAEDVKIEIIDEPLDWTVVLKDDSFMGLKPGESRSVTLDVTPPKDALADEVGSITLKAFIQTLPQIKSMASVHVVVNACLYLRLTIDAPQKYVDPGNATDYTLTVMNEGNMAGIVVFILEIKSGVGDWDVTLDRTSVAVPNNGRMDVKLTVVAPENAKAGTRLVVRVVASDEARTMNAEITATTVVNQVHNLDVATFPPEVQVKPGETANYEVTIKNNGNGPEQLVLTPDALRVAWVPGFLQDNVPVDQVILEPGEQKAYTVALKVPGSELAGSYVSSFKLSSVGTQWSYKFDLTTRVLQIYSIDVTSALSKKTGTPGKTVSFIILLRNNGNGDDVIALNLDDKPINWDSRFLLDDKDVDAVPLKSGEQAKVTLLLVIPFTYDQDNTQYTMTVTGTSEGRIQDRVLLMVDLFLPNLKILSVKYSTTHFTANKPVSIEVVVSNIGQVPCENVTVRFYDKNIAGEQVLERMPAGGNLTAVITWMPRAGQHKLEFQVDPDNKVIESNEDDNKVVDKVNVRMGVGDYGVPGFDASLLLLALVPMALLLGRRKN